MYIYIYTYISWSSTLSVYRISYIVSLEYVAKIFWPHFGRQATGLQPNACVAKIHPKLEFWPHFGRQATALQPNAWVAKAWPKLERGQNKTLRGQNFWPPIPNSWPKSCNRVAKITDAWPKSTDAWPKLTLRRGQNVAKMNQFVHKAYRPYIRFNGIHYRPLRNNSMVEILVDCCNKLAC